MYLIHVSETAATTDIDPVAAERAALMDLFHAANGGQWRQSGSWGSASNHCSWFGVDCNQTNSSRVTTLTLYDNLLMGTIPPSLQVLDQVEYFALSTNKLVGSLPAFKFRRNKYFDVRYNFLNGSIDTSGMPSLTHLVVSDNRFTGGLDLLGLDQKLNLTYLDISSNRLQSSQVTESICALNLTYCSLASKFKTNKFTNVPPCVTRQCVV